ncbi:MAG: hypothetical protein LUE13_10985 [Akkermansiaceae bacterium]|nr:hypothetical protein [Akkermansiaceae bacterium]
MFTMVSAQRFRPSISPCCPANPTIRFLMAEFRLKDLFSYRLPVSRQKAINVSMKSFSLPDVNPAFRSFPEDCNKSRFYLPAFLSALPAS